MTRRRPFWTEDLTAEQRDARVHELLHVLLGCSELDRDRLVVFVPDPPTANFDDAARRCECTLHWGTAGRAAATRSLPCATRTAEAMFELWSESLTVLALDSVSAEPDVLSAWITEFFGKPRSGLVPPLLRFATFDWGELVTD